MKLDVILLIVMLLASLWAVMARSLLKAAIGLALASVMLSVIMFRFASPLAAVFELSVCAGLITVIFISTISLTRPKSADEKAEESRARNRRYWLLPVLLIVVALLIGKLPGLSHLLVPHPIPDGADVGNVLWNARRIDLLGQMIILLAGVWGVVALFKGKDTNA